MIKSIANDNVEQFEKDFGSYIQEGNVFFGAYSLLSVLYIFNAKKILKEYQSILIENYNKEEIPFDDEIRFDDEKLIGEKFSNIARVNYREYKNAKNISPVEVLVLQGKLNKAIKLCKSINLDKEQNKRLKNLLKECNNIEDFNFNNFALERNYHKMSLIQLFCIILSFIFISFSLIFILATTKVYNIYVNGQLISSYQTFREIDFSIAERDVNNYKHKHYDSSYYVITGPYQDANYQTLYKPEDKGAKNYYYRILMQASDAITCNVYIYNQNNLQYYYTEISYDINQFKNELIEKFEVNQLKHNPTTNHFESKTVLSGPFKDSNYSQEYVKGYRYAYFKIVNKW